MSSLFHNNAISAQLDILYEFCQWMLAQWYRLGRGHITLYRGVNRFDEDRLVTEDQHGRRALVRLNNLVSFSSDPEIAGQFGDYVLEARVPAAKILFFNGLIPAPPLNGESEYLVIGGEYQVRVNH
jgi:NAD+--dinitrogen-reductase ADP-D-ribosyltransferase